MSDYRSLPVDQTALDALAGSGLRFDLVDGTDVAAFGRWYNADARGFHDAAPTDEEIARGSTGVGDRRTTGVWDATAAEPDVPVATVASWPVELTVPGQRSVPAWAISSVTVAPTHRRRGIARQMLESELRAASALGLPVAILTVSEATIYGRYGFAPAVMAANYTIEKTRTSWTGPAASGSVSFVSGERLKSDGPDIVERARLTSPGEITRWDGLWDEMLQTAEPEKARKLRAVRYDDVDGTPQGFAIYQVHVSSEPPRRRSLDVEHLIAVTDDAYAGLWRFFLEQDLIDTITAPLRAVDEPLVWQVSNRRAIVKQNERDHLWNRILDVPAALQARRYLSDGRLVIEVTDVLGYAAGRFTIEVRDGAAEVSPSTEHADVSMSVNELSALYLGGVGASELFHAGRLVAASDGVAILDRLFRTPSAPWLSIWF